jgi:hypothetical protein
MVDPDNSSDARQIREYEARQNNNKKNNNNNDWSKKSENGSNKIQGKWTNPVQNVRSTGGQSRGTESQGGADIKFTKESAIQKPEYHTMTMQFEGALETRCSALQRQYEGQLTEMKEEIKTLKDDIKGVHYVMEQLRETVIRRRIN